MKFMDLNADIGEATTPEGQQAEADILNYVSSANIACGGHAGTPETMRTTVRAAKACGVNIGAHPGYPDKENFGRTSMTLGKDIDPKYLRDSLREQILSLAQIASEEGMRLTYVKPHGAAYNDSVTSPEHADLIASVIADIDPSLIFMGGPNSEMGKAAKAHGLKFVPEGFIDRRYTDAGHLQSRAIDGAVITKQSARMAQAEALVTTQTVVTASGTSLKIDARSLCLHGDSAGAVETARLARKTIEAAGVKIKAFTHVE